MLTLECNESEFSSLIMYERSTNWLEYNDHYASSYARTTSIIAIHSVHSVPKISSILPTTLLK